MHQKDHHLGITFFFNLLSFSGFFFKDYRPVITEESFVDDGKITINRRMLLLKLFILISELRGQFNPHGPLIPIQFGVPAAFKARNRLFGLLHQFFPIILCFFFDIAWRKGTGQFLKKFSPNLIYFLSILMHIFLNSKILLILRAPSNREYFGSPFLPNILNLILLIRPNLGIIIPYLTGRFHNLIRNRFFNLNTIHLNLLLK